jgi:hypothetical protein
VVAKLILRRDVKLNTSTRYKKDCTRSLAEFSDAALPSSSGLWCWTLSRQRGNAESIPSSGHCLELRRQLFIRRDHLDKPSSPFEIYSQGDINEALRMAFR